VWAYGFGIMKKILKIIIIFIVFWILVITSLTVIAINKKPEVILYYGISCPHCKNVEKFIEDNKINQKLRIVLKEVWEEKNAANAVELQIKAKKCGFKPDGIGVPFLVYGEKCYVGEEEIVSFLTESAAGVSK
jgi:glutaredoxin